MNPFLLEGHTPYGHAASVWGCGVCLKTCLDEQHAITCCAPYRCRTCGSETPRYVTKCDACRHSDVVAAEHAQLAKAIKVAATDYDHDMVYTATGDYKSLEEVLDDGEDAWAWACVECTPRLDAQSILEGMCEDLYEDAFEHFDVDKLQALLDAYIAGQWVHARCYEADHSRVVILKKEEECDD